MLSEGIREAETSGDRWEEIETSEDKSKRSPNTVQNQSFRKTVGY